MAAYVFITSAGQTFALPAGEVVEVLRMAAPSPVPGAPAAVRGLLDVRGEVMPVIDAGVALGAPRRALRLEDHLVVLDAGGRLLALAVERVTGLRELPEGARADAAGAEAVRLEDGVVVVQGARAWLARAGGPAAHAASGPRPSTPP